MRERWWALVSIAAWLAFFAAALYAPAFEGKHGTAQWGLGITLQIISVAVGVALLTQLLFTAERGSWPLWSRWALFLGGAATVVAMWRLNATGLWMALHAVALCAIALPVGYWIGSQMLRVTYLIPLGVAMTMADIFSVFQGPSKQIAHDITAYETHAYQQAVDQSQGLSPAQLAQAYAHEQHTEHAPLAKYLAAHMAMMGKGWSVPVLGIGDFIALAFLFRVAWVHRLRPGLVFGAALVSTLAALGLAQLTRLSLPALPVICLGTLGILALFEPRLRRLDRQEIVLSVGVVLLFGALIAARWVMGS